MSESIELLAMKRLPDGGETCCDTEPFDNNIKPDFYCVFVTKPLPGGGIEVIEESDFSDYTDADNYRRDLVKPGPQTGPQAGGNNG